jgi:hypothetical protein
MEWELDAIASLGLDPAIAVMLVLLVRLWYTDCGGCERRVRRALDKLHEQWEKTYIER